MKANGRGVDAEAEVEVVGEEGSLSLVEGVERSGARSKGRVELELDLCWYPPVTDLTGERVFDSDSPNVEEDVAADEFHLEGAASISCSC